MHHFSPWHISFISVVILCWPTKPFCFSVYPSFFPTAFIVAVIQLYLHSLMQQGLLHFGWQVRFFCGLLSITLSLLLPSSFDFNTRWSREQQDSSVGSNTVRLADRKCQLSMKNDFKLCRNQGPWAASAQFVQRSCPERCAAQGIVCLRAVLLLDDLQEGFLGMYTCLLRIAQR